MKRLPFLLLCALALLVNACEMHKASELPAEHGKGEVAAEEHAAAPQPAGEKKAEEAKPGEAPKFFPEKK